MVFSNEGIEDRRWVPVADFLKVEVIAIAVYVESAFGLSLANLILDYYPAQFYFSQQDHRICASN